MNVGEQVFEEEGGVLTARVVIKGCRALLRKERERLETIVDDCLIDVSNELPGWDVVKIVFIPLEDPDLSAR